MFETLKEDLDTVLARDPAAHSRLEVFFCYPGFRAVRRHRRAHRAYEKGRFFRARLIAARTKKMTGIEIHPGAVIGKRLFIDHGSGVVIGETAVIGDDVTLYQGVTLGGTGKDTGKRHPTLGNGVTVGAGAIVLKSVPDQCTVVGNPGRIVKGPPGRPDIDLNHGDLPDPMLDRMQALYQRLCRLEKRLTDQAERMECASCPVTNCKDRETEGK